MKKFFIFTILLVSFFISKIDTFASTTYKQGVVTATSTIRVSASNSASAVKNDTGGTIILYLPEAVEVIGESGNFYQIKFIYSGFIYTGYIPKGNISVKEYTTDDAYEQSLINAGFPSDYAKKLAILHAIHPNWTFTPSYTGGVSGGMDFYTAVSGEASVVDRNLISGSNTSLRSTADGAYQNGKWVEFSGGGWYAASYQTISFFLDPRNFLDESHIFMFENLGYNPVTQTSTAVNKILSGTFMNNPFTCSAGANSCSVGSHSFTDTFMQAGSDKKVSPVHLASRVRQEQGTNGSALSLGLGYNYNGSLQYVGYYNFFNIAASGTTTADVILNGLKYAYNKNWNNQYISIYDGSSLISSNYINRGQSTLYYQKFNTIVNSLYGNQYMQNIKAPYSESYSTYTSYYKSYSSQAEWNNATYDFLIPVYTNMGGSTTLDTSGNSDSTLSSLTVKSCNLNPSFQSSAYNYDCYVSLDTSSVSIEATATNALAKVDNPGVVNLSSNDVTTHVTVTAANGTTSTYTINIHRIETDGYTPTEVLNGVGIKVSGSYISNIALGSDVSNIISSVSNKYHFASVKVYEANGSEIKDGTVKTGQKVTVSNAGLTTTFTIVIYGDTGGDGLIDIRDLLIIQKHLVKSKTISGEYYSAGDINKDGTIDIRDLLLEQKYLLGLYSISQG